MNETIQSSITDANTSTIFVEKLFQRITLGCFLSSLSIFTVCGNILVLYAIQTEKNLRTVSNLFILSLALADLSVGLFVMPLSAANIIAGRWPFSSVICKMWLSIDYVARRHIKENKGHKSLDLSKLTPDNDSIITKQSSSESHSMKYSMIIYAQKNSKKLLSPISKQPSIKRSASRTSMASSFSDEYSETTFNNPIENQRKLKPMPNITLKMPTAVDDLQTTSSSSKVMVTTTPGTDSIATLINDSSTSSPIDSSTKMNFSFFTTLINPSRSYSLQKELKAARQLGMLVGVFTVSWLPYFILFLVVAWCNDCVSDGIFTASIWLGYLNSTFNPLIYPLCNAHFRLAFQKICYCSHEKKKLPNLGALRELHALHSMRRQRR
ncbi:unnamed protein product [Rotaria magnacalcarata]|uniref:G-protein coupled receptors family 1 profile domain-containing protein n=1 Tax=Rotaria magnacalcarata TaxID=392030 RepID=A0A8S2J4G4_9BILA|nr:unnamed protein product [Rotaria magnacalcarata]